MEPSAKPIEAVKKDDPTLFLASAVNSARLLSSFLNSFDATCTASASTCAAGVGNTSCSASSATGSDSVPDESSEESELEALLSLEDDPSSPPLSPAESESLCSSSARLESTSKAFGFELWFLRCSGPLF